VKQAVYDVIKKDIESSFDRLEKDKHIIELRTDEELDRGREQTNNLKDKEWGEKRIEKGDMGWREEDEMKWKEEKEKKETNQNQTPENKIDNSKETLKKELVEKVVEVYMSYNKEDRKETLIVTSSNEIRREVNNKIRKAIKEENKKEQTNIKKNIGINNEGNTKIVNDNKENNKNDIKVNNGNINGNIKNNSLADIDKKYIDNLSNNISKLLSQNPVAEITGNDFVGLNKKETTRQVYEYFKNKDKINLFNPEIGNVKITKNGLMDSYNHWIDKDKIAAFKCIDSIVENGIVFRKENNWKNRGYNSYLLASLIKINENEYIAEAVVNEYPNGDKTFYLHNVEKKEVPTQRILNADAPDNSNGTSSKLILTNFIHNVKQNTLKKEQNNSLSDTVEINKQNISNKEQNNYVSDRRQNNSILDKEQNNLIPNIIELKDLKNPDQIHRVEKKYIDNLDSNIKSLLDMKPVAELTGNEFPNNGESIIDRVSEYYKSIGDKVIRSDIGKIQLSKNGIKDSIKHGIYGKKIEAFKAIPEIIRDGILINKEYNWKERGYNTYLIGAVIEIQKEEYIAEVVVRESSRGDRTFYLHQLDIKENLLGLPPSRTVSSSPQKVAFKGIIAQMVDNVKQFNLENKPEQTTHQQENKKQEQQQIEHPQTTTISTLEIKSLTQQEKKEIENYQIGDRIIFTKENTTLGTEKGIEYKVIEKNTDIIIEENAATKINTTIEKNTIAEQSMVAIETNNKDNTSNINNNNLIAISNGEKTIYLDISKHNTNFNIYNKVDKELTINDQIKWTDTDKEKGIIKNSSLTVKDIKMVNIINLDMNTNTSTNINIKENTNTKLMNTNVSINQTLNANNKDNNNTINRNSNKDNIGNNINNIDISNNNNTHQTTTLITILDNRTNKEITLDLNNKEDQKILKHIDYNYVTTSYSAQGKTSKNVILTAESYRPNLTTMKDFYVGLSRTKNNVTIITDNITNTKNALLENTGEKLGAMEVEKKHKDIKVIEENNKVNNKVIEDKTNLVDETTKINKVSLIDNIDSVTKVNEINKTINDKIEKIGEIGTRNEKNNKNIIRNNKKDRDDLDL
jgi:hypothetical protein